MLIWGYTNGRIGSMSYNIIKQNEVLNEGVTYIQDKYPFYNKKKLVDEYSEEKYCFQMIEECLTEDGIKNILKMMIFDILIGNSDRHHSNWGIVIHINTYKGFESHFCPLYDNGSSLCSYVNEEDIDTILKDRMRFGALVDTKSQSTIGWKNKRPIRHFELLEHLKEEKYNDTIEYIENIKNNINEQSINNILNEFDNNIISENMKKLVKEYLLERRKRILDIYNLEDK